MKRFKLEKSRKLSSVFLIYSTVIALIATILFGGLYTYVQFHDFNKDSELARKNYIESQKAIVKNETEKVIDYIDYTRLFIEDKMKSDLREKTIQAWLIIDNIYQSNKNGLSREKIGKIVKDALRPIRFNKGRGYYFLVSMDGTEQLYPVAPQYEGQNLLNLKDDKGNYVIQDEINLIKKSEEGFVTDYWSKPGADKTKLYPKISFVKLYEPLNWYVGCGEYLDNVERDIQEEVKQKIKKIRFGNDGYLFVNTFEGKAVIIDSDKYKEGDDIYDLTDPKGVKVVQEELKAAKNPNGGFIEYQWKKPNNQKNEDKIAFVKAIPAWRWVIGAGVYVDEINAKIASERKLLYLNVKNQLIISFFVLLTIFGLIFYVARKMSIKIGSNFELFTRKLSQAVNKGDMLDKGSFTIYDLQLVVEDINKVIHTKNIAEKALKENESIFRAIFENVPVMIAVLDKDRKRRMWNTKIDKIFNFDHDQQVDLPTIKTLLTDSPVNQNFEELFKAPTGKFWELEMNTKMGVQNHNWAFLKTENGEIVLVGYEITEIKETQRKLKELNATKDKFFSIIAHDLRGPVGALITFLELFTQDQYHATEEQMKANLNVMKVASKNTYDLLDNLLIWAKSQMHEISFTPKANSLNDLIDQNMKLFSYVAKDKNINLVCNDIPKLYAVFDYEMVNTVLRNLINNAIKYTKSNGSVIISAQKREQGIAITVEDTGVGLKEQVRQNLFKIDKKNVSTMGTSGEKGSGLGLILCKEFVDQHGGEIHVESVLGKGSSFTFTLPQA